MTRPPDGTAVVAAMVAAVDEPALRELARELTRRPRHDGPRKRRLHELGRLRSLLDGVAPAGGVSFPVIPKQDYDRDRNAADPTGDTLARRYGSWRRACRAAASMSATGARIGPANPWPHVAPSTRPYTLDETLDALRLYWRQSGRRPTPTTYTRWVRETRRRGGANNLRLPPARTIYRFFPASAGGWRAAIEAARIARISDTAERAT